MSKVFKKILTVFFVFLIFSVTQVNNLSAQAAQSSYTEDFSNISLGGSYSSGSHTGANGQLWKYTDSRGDQTLDGKALLLRSGS
ncbi:MAG TPA: hypothetical protein GXZ79_05465, partial [Acholeplasma sp.]|nr:hypothetical protein [Acholeplasma sp.]